MSDLVLGVVIGGILGVAGGVVNTFIQRWGKKEEMNETRRRNAASAALEIMKMAPIDDKGRNKFTKHYGMLYRKLLELLRAPEK